MSTSVEGTLHLHDSHGVTVEAMRLASIRSLMEIFGRRWLASGYRVP